MRYLELFFAFLKVGCFAFGGAYGAIPLIRDVVLVHGWLNEETLTYMIAVSESTPGPIMVNLATYVGSTQAGFFGAAAATLGVILPSFVIILFITAALNRTLKNRYVQAILRGVKPCVIGIILATGIWMIVENCLIGADGAGVDRKAAGITLFLIVVSGGYKRIFKKKLSPVMLIVIAAAAGVIVYGG